MVRVVKGIRPPLTKVCPHWLWKYLPKIFILLPELPVLLGRHPVQVLQVVTFRILIMYPDAGLKRTIWSIKADVVTSKPFRMLLDQRAHINTILKAESLVQTSKAVE